MKEYLIFSEYLDELICPFSEQFTFRNDLCYPDLIRFDETGAPHTHTLPDDYNQRLMMFYAAGLTSTGEKPQPTCPNCCTKIKQVEYEYGLSASWCPSCEGEDGPFRKLCIKG